MALAGCGVALRAWTCYRAARLIPPLATLSCLIDFGDLIELELCLDGTTFDSERWQG